MKAGSWKALVVVGLLCLATSVLSAQTFTALIDFEGTDGSGLGPVIQGLNGSFYGISGGGAGTFCGSSGCGMIFEITPAGKVITLYSFCTQKNCPDGLSPSGLMQASNGNLYGTTNLRGANHGGTIFELTPSGKFTTLYSFCAQANCADRSRPVGALVQGVDGKLYGVTENGGDTFCASGCGTMFQVTLSGQFKLVFSFCAKTDCVKEGRNPEAGLVAARTGTFMEQQLGVAPNKKAPSSRLRQRVR
ncbi:MAG TPA: choice-of-anchor tandem repeat GloVer-containing protein [Candidatus Angelobacter sp.]|nr:choice-of-anchor tandem repeat GloVer-containing protein [Candidatus Angelobacter sp.]